MTDATALRHNILPTDVDAQGGVVLWDHNGDVPVPLRMHQSDAAHAMSVDPTRYSMEPEGVDESEIEKRVQEIKAKRDAAADAPQRALDRKAAVDSIMSDRRSAASAAAVDSTPETSPVPASTATPVQEVAPPTPESPPWVTPGTEH